MFGIVINKDGYKVSFICLNVSGNPIEYEMEDGYNIIEQDWSIANAMNKPKWNGAEWIETEPLPETEPTEPKLSETELLMLAVAELDMQRAIDKTEVEMAIAELAETMLGGI